MSDETPQEVEQKAQGAPSQTANAGSAVQEPWTRRYSSFDEEDLREIAAHQRYLARRNWLTIGGLALMLVLALMLFRVMGRGTMLSRMSKAELSEVTRIADEQPGDRDIQLAAGKREVDEGFFKEAYARMQRLADKMPDDTMVLTGLARTAAMAADAHGAVEAYHRLLERSPREIISRSMLAQIYTEAGLYTDALAQFDEITRQDPSFLSRNPLVGRCLVEVGRFDDAIKQLSTVVTEMRMADEAFLVLSYAAIKTGRQAEVLPLFERRLTMSSLYPYGEVRHGMALLLLSLPRTQDHLIAAEKLARTASGDDRAEYYWGHAHVLTQQGKWKEALTAARKGLKREPEHRKCLWVVAEAARRTGDQTAATQASAKLAKLEAAEQTLKDLKARVGSEPQSRDASLALAAEYERLGRHAMAAEAIQALIRRTGQDPEAAQLLSRYRKAALDNLVMSTTDVPAPRLFIPEE